MTSEQRNSFEHAFFFCKIQILMFLLLIHTYFYIIFIYVYWKPLCDFMPVKGAIQISFKVHLACKRGPECPTQVHERATVALGYRTPF